jgi:UDP-glucose:(heptosyl)LPS alpha-1,3-glucosyltransferase
MRLAVTLEKLDLTRGGAEVATLRLIRELAARGHEVHVLTTAATVELPPGVEVKTVPLPGKFVAWRQISFARRVSAALRMGNYDLSIAAAGRGFSEDALWAQCGTHRGSAEGKIRSCYFNPLLQWLRRGQDFFNIRTFVYRELERRHFARRPQPYVIAPSRMIAEEFQKYHGLSPERIRVVPYQVNLERFSPERMAKLRAGSRAALGFNEQRLLILCVAQNFRRKGVRPLVEAAARLQQKRNDFTLIVAGLNARHAAPYLRLATKLRCADRVRFIGHHPAIEALYAAADVFCLPTFCDPCAIASIEAMACGLPSITSRYNGAAELMDHGVNGFIIAEPQESATLALQLEQLFDSALRQSIGAAAARRAFEICRENPANEIACVVEDLARCRDKELSAAPATATSAAATTG